MGAQEDPKDEEEKESKEIKERIINPNFINCFSPHNPFNLI